MAMGHGLYDHRKREVGEVMSRYEPIGEMDFRR